MAVDDAAHVACRGLHAEVAELVQFVADQGDMLVRSLA